MDPPRSTTAALANNWLTTVCVQNAVMHEVTQATAALAVQEISAVAAAPDLFTHGPLGREMNR